MKINVKVTESHSPSDTACYEIYPPGCAIGAGVGCEVQLVALENEEQGPIAILNCAEEKCAYFTNMSVTRSVILNGEKARFGMQVPLLSHNELSIEQYNIIMNINDDDFLTAHQETSAVLISSDDDEKMWQELDIYLSKFELQGQDVGAVKENTFAKDYSRRELNPLEPLLLLDEDVHLDELSIRETDILTLFSEGESIGNNNFMFEAGESTLPNYYNNSLSWSPTAKTGDDPLIYYKGNNYKIDNGIVLYSNNKMTDCIFSHDLRMPCQSGDFFYKDTLVLDNLPAGRVSNKFFSLKQFVIQKIRLLKRNFDTKISHGFFQKIIFRRGDVE